MVLINLHRNLHEKSSFLSEIMFIRINPYLCHLLTRYQSTIFPNHKSCVRKKGVPVMIHRLFIRRFGKSLGIKNKKTERYRTNRAKPTIERQKRGRKSGNRKPSRNRKNGAITDTPTPTPTPTPLPSLPDFSDTSYEMFPNRQKKTPHI